MYNKYSTSIGLFSYSPPWQLSLDSIRTDWIIRWCFDMLLRMWGIFFVSKYSGLVTKSLIILNSVMYCMDKVFLSTLLPEHVHLII